MLTNKTKKPLLHDCKIISIRSDTPVKTEAFDNKIDPLLETALKIAKSIPTIGAFEKVTQSSIKFNHLKDVLRLCETINSTDGEFAKKTLEKMRENMRSMESQGPVKRNSKELKISSDLSDIE